MVATVHNVSGSRPKTYPRGRVCSACDAVLSIYNSQGVCAQCEIVPRRMSDAEHRASLRALADVLAAER